MKKVVPAGQMSLFDILFPGLQAEELEAFTRRVKTRRRTKKKRRAKGLLQYKLRLKLKPSPRKLAFRSKAPKESHLGNDEGWSDSAVLRLHYVLLIDTLLTLRTLGEHDSAKAEEILLWVTADYDAPFNFKTCVQIAQHLSMQPNFRNPYPEIDLDLAGLDEVQLRSLIVRRVRQQFGSPPTYFMRLVEGLRYAATGTLSGLDWCLSQDTGPMSFRACCDALGFEPMECLELVKARRSIKVA